MKRWQISAAAGSWAVLYATLPVINDYTGVRPAGCIQYLEFGETLLTC